MFICLFKKKIVYYLESADVLRLILWFGKDRALRELSCHWSHTKSYHTDFFYIILCQLQHHCQIIKHALVNLSFDQFSYIISDVYYNLTAPSY